MTDTPDEVLRHARQIIQRGPNVPWAERYAVIDAIDLVVNTHRAQGAAMKAAREARVLGEYWATEYASQMASFTVSDKARAAIDAMPSAPVIAGGSPEHMMQDLNRDLSQWLSNQPGAKLHATEAAAEIALASAPADCLYIAFSTDRKAIRFWTHDARVAEDWSADNGVEMTAYCATTAPAPLRVDIAGTLDAEAEGKRKAYQATGDNQYLHEYGSLLQAARLVRDSAPAPMPAERDCNSCEHAGRSEMADPCEPCLDDWMAGKGRTRWVAVPPMANGLTDPNAGIGMASCGKPLCSN